MATKSTEQFEKADYIIEGITKREYFASMALQGLLANPFYTQGKYDTAKHIAGLPAVAVGMADRLLKELLKEN